MSIEFYARFIKKIVTTFALKRVLHVIVHILANKKLPFDAF